MGYGPPRIVRRDSTETWSGQQISLAQIVSEAVSGRTFPETLRSIRESAVAISAFLKSLTIDMPNPDAISTVSTSLTESLHRIISGMYFETDHHMGLLKLMTAGVLFNQERIVKACYNLSKLDAESRKRDGVYMSEAADLVSKSFRAFSEADKLAAQDVQNEFKLFVASIGSKQRLAMRSAILWSLTAAMNSFFTARAISP